MSHKNVCQVLGKSSGGIAQNLTLSYLILYLWTGVIPRCANHESPPSSILGVFPPVVQVFHLQECQIVTTQSAQLASYLT